MKSDNRGFSLLELLIYTAVLAVMSTVIVNVFLSITKGQGKFTAESEVNSNLRFAIEKINQDIRAASAVTTPGSPGGTTSLVMTIGIDTITYCIPDGILRRQLNGACVGGPTGSPTVTGDQMEVTCPGNVCFTRLENSNTQLSPTKAISIITSINIAYKGTNPDLQYSATRTATELVPYYQL